MAAPAVTSATNEVERFLEEAKQTEAARRKGELARNTLELKLQDLPLTASCKPRRPTISGKGSRRVRHRSGSNTTRLFMAWRSKAKRLQTTCGHTVPVGGNPGHLG